jgi:hypothetical protein
MPETAATIGSLGATTPEQVYTALDKLQKLKGMSPGMARELQHFGTLMSAENIAAQSPSASEVIQRTLADPASLGAAGVGGLLGTSTLLAPVLGPMAPLVGAGIGLTGNFARNAYSARPALEKMLAQLTPEEMRIVRSHAGPRAESLLRSLNQTL